MSDRLRACHLLHPDASGRHPPTHPWHELLLPLRGRHVVAAAGGDLVAAAGSALLVPAGCRHQPRVQRGCRLFVVQWDGVAPAAQPFVVADAGGRMAALCGLLHELPDSAATRPQRRRLFAALLGELALARSDTGAVTDPIAGVRRFLLDTPAHPLRLDALAARAGISRATLLRGFRARFGEAPVAFHRRQRAALAQRLLAVPPVDHAAIAQRIGLPDRQALRRFLARQ